MKKTTVVLLALALSASLLGPAEAGKKKKIKPYVSESVTIQLAHSAQYGNSGTVATVTGQEFINTCAIPNSNGFDSYVFEVPAAWQKAEASLEAIGDSATTVAYDLDLFTFDASCAITLAAQGTGGDETTVMPKGTAYILIHNFGSATDAGGGDPVTAHIELKPYKAPTY